MIKFHPTDTHLVNYVEGTLPSTASVLVSAHCDMCNECLHKAQIFTDKISEKWLDSSSNSDEMSGDFMSMFDSITSNSSRNLHVDNKFKHKLFLDETQSSKIELDGKVFTLPPTLARFIDRVGEWSHLVGKLWLAPVEIGGGNLAQFIYMEKGGSVPEHTHRGNEFTLVIDGKFVDGPLTYDCGDFIALDSSHTHSPSSGLDEGCLVFCIIDQPLFFTSRWAKIINPLSTLYFKAHT